jgi:transcriptional regulator with XRE-family HTH domain
MSESQKFAERLNAALDAADIPKTGAGRQSALVDALGTSHKNIRRWLEGEEFPPTSKLVKLATLTGVRSNWLLSGQGDMHPAAFEFGENTSEVKEFANTLSKEAFEVASDWMRLPESQRMAIKLVIQQLCDVEESDLD